MAKPRKFCTLVSHVNYKPWDDSVPKWAWSWSRDLLKFWEVSDNISEMVQHKDDVTTAHY